MRRRFDRLIGHALAHCRGRNFGGGGARAVLQRCQPDGACVAEHKSCGGRRRALKVGLTLRWRGRTVATLQEMFDVRGKSVIVTGGASGIGRAYAEVVAENGARVCVFDIDARGADSVVAEIAATAPSLGSGPGRRRPRRDGRGLRRCCGTAWTGQRGLRQCGDRCRAWFPVHRRRIASEGAIDLLDDHRWDRVIEVNLTSVYTTVKMPRAT